MLSRRSESPAAGLRKAWCLRVQGAARRKAPGCQMRFLHRQQHIGDGIGHGVTQQRHRAAARPQDGADRGCADVLPRNGPHQQRPLDLQDLVPHPQRQAGRPQRHQQAD
ncbi:hypothetical protein G6F22_017938 [Rhizopus arrhizus]|nr:hypothetical protein G6F22_017938 [Rhizopus arrhizus]